MERFKRICPLTRLLAKCYQRPPRLHLSTPEIAPKLHVGIVFVENRRYVKHQGWSPVKVRATLAFWHLTKARSSVFPTLLKQRNPLLDSMSIVNEAGSISLCLHLTAQYTHTNHPLTLVRPEMAMQSLLGPQSGLHMSFFRT